MVEGAPKRGLGEALEHAREDGFFRWFHLTEVDDSDAIAASHDAAEGTVWRRFRPSGARFQALTELDLAVDQRDGIQAACLGIDRAFIDAASIRPFARDIMKSYLNWILPADAAVALAAVVDEVGRFCDGESTVIVRASAVRPSWFGWWRRRSGDEADVFMGKIARASRQVGRTRIVFENVSGPLPQGVAWLRIVVSAT